MFFSPVVVFMIKAQVGLLIEWQLQGCHAAVLIVITALEQKVPYCETGNTSLTDHF